MRVYATGLRVLGCNHWTPLLPDRAICQSYVPATDLPGSLSPTQWGRLAAVFVPTRICL